MVRALLLLFLLIQVSCNSRVARDLMVNLQAVAVVAGLGVVALVLALVLGELWMVVTSARALWRKEAPPWTVVALAPLSFFAHGAISLWAFRNMLRTQGTVGPLEWVACLSLVLPTFALAWGLTALLRPRPLWLAPVSALLSGAVVGLGVFALLSPWVDRSVPPPGRLTQLALETNYRCATTSTGAVACWGHNSSGQLGSAAPPNHRSRPSLVPGVSGATAVIVGGSHSCALVQNGQVLCWGGNFEGELGPDLPASLTQPTLLPGVQDVVELLHQGRTLWLRTASGSLVRRSKAQSQGALPERDTVPAETVQVVFGEQFWCARVRTGNMTCRVKESLFPLMSGTATAMAATTKQVCAVLITGEVSCANPFEVYAERARNRSKEAARCTEQKEQALAQQRDAQQLAQRLLPETTCDPSTEPEPAPGQVVAGLLDARAIAGGNNHLCALTQDGQVRCWGNGWYGQLGDGSLERHEDARPVLLPGPASQVLALEDDSCAWLKDQRLFCWGDALGTQDVNCHSTLLGTVWCTPKPSEVVLF